jgi:hypothetical protein
VDPGGSKGYEEKPRACPHEDVGGCYSLNVYVPPKCVC